MDMDRDNRMSSSTESQSVQEINTTNDLESSPFDVDKCEQVFITHIRVMDGVYGLCHRQASLYVTMEINNELTQTSTRPVSAGEDVVEWDDEICLPSERSSTIYFKVYGTVELGSKSGNGELLGELKTTVRDMVDRKEQPYAIKFLNETQETTTSSFMLRIIIERRILKPDVHLLDTCAARLEQLNDEGHRALLRYHQLQNQTDVDEAIACFERAQYLCPIDHPNRSAILSNLADAKFARYENNDQNLDLDGSITLYRDALQLRSSSHPDRGQTLFDLGVALLTRFQSRGDEADRAEAKELLSTVVRRLPLDSDAYSEACLALQMTEMSVARASSRPQTDAEDVSIRDARARLQDLSDSDPRKPEVLADLGRLLYNRFEDNGDLLDINEAVSVLESAIQLTPGDHPLKIGWLNNLGSSLFARFHRIDDLADIDRSILISEEAVGLTSDSHPNKPATLSNLATSLSSRFERLGNLADLNKSISLMEEAAHRTPDGHPTKPAMLNNLGNSISLRFQHLGELVDIDNSISMKQKAVDLTLSGHPLRPTMLGSLGDSLSRRFDRLGELADLNKSILMIEEAVRLTSNGHPDKPGRLNDLGFSLFRRFERLGDIADINKSISIFEETIRLVPDGHPSKPRQLNNLGTSLSRRFERLGNLVDLHKSISMAEKAVHLTPKDHPDRPRRLSNLGFSLYNRFERLGDITDINKSISIFEEAVSLTPDGNPDKPGLFNNLGSSLLSRFERLEDMADVDKSISVLEEAIRITPAGHPDKSDGFSNLGSSSLRRFERLGDLEDINKAISVFEEALHLTPDGHPNKPTLLSNLGTSLLRRFGRLGNLEDIDKSVRVLDEAVRLVPVGHHNKRLKLASLGNSLLSRFEHLGDLMDINWSVLVFKDVVSITPDNHPEKPGDLGNLGNSLLRRFERLGDLADINSSISVLEQAVALTPNDHPSKPARFSNLGCSLSRRFQRLGDLSDINKSISMLEEAIKLTPDGHPDKADWYTNLGSSFSAHFRRSGDLTAIDKSISMFELALRLTPDGHPDKPSLCLSLGSTFMAYYQHSRDPSHLSAATLHLSVGSRASIGSTAIRFRTTQLWISSAQLQGNTQTLLDAYTTAITLLPQLAWLGLPLTERHRVLVDAADVARDAAAAALEAGQPEMAVEWLEQGRSIVWNQLLQLRDPVDELRVKHPGLAHQFQQVSQQLEHTSSRHHPTFHQLKNSVQIEARSMENEVQRHHDLALRRERLLSEIRSLPGFDRFLLPKTVEQLAVWASSGPVVYLNASKHRCDALIIKPESADVIPVSLPGVSYRKVEEVLCVLLQRNYPRASRDDIQPFADSPAEVFPLQYFLDMLSMEDSNVQGRDREGGLWEVEEHSPEGRFRRVLAFLWRKVVNPVLVALVFSVPPSDNEKMKRIIWCPTGPFAFLPIHAAGLYDTSQAGTKLSDFAISSYIPILGALVPPGGKDRKEPSSNIHIVTVPQPPNDGQFKLSGVKEEIDYIQTLSAKSPLVSLQHSLGTVEDVMAKMMNADWVHFACHGVQDPKNPLDSGLCLADHRRLKLSDIIQLSRPQGGLAFLSACQTAQGDEKLSEESVHLAAGMLLAGYGSVIATMWSIMDRDAPRVTKDVYEHLFRDDGKVPDSADAAEALHLAIRGLRNSGATFASWVPFIHIGQ